MADRYKGRSGGAGVALVVTGEACDADVLDALDEARDEYLYGEPE